MTMSDPIADMLTRIRNANTAKHDTVDVPASKMKIAIADILVNEGYITKYDIVEEGNFNTIRITLKYGADKNEKVISGIKKISKPGLRVYAGKDELPRVLGGLGTAIISTNQGVITDKEARKLGVEIMKLLSELEKTEYRFKLKLPIGCSDRELFYGMLEASAKLMRIPKYNIYTADELWNETSRKYETRTDEGKEKLPKFVHAIAKLRKDYKMNLKGRSFLKLEDYTPAEIEYLVDLAGELKAKKKAGIKGHSLEGKNIALIFEKPSTRTRCAFTVGAQDEGGIPTYLAGNEIQLGDKESIEDTARVLGRMFDGIEFRGFEQRYADVLAEYSGIPVWNGLTDTTHPTQCLAMLLTMKEEFGHLKGLKVAYLGDGRNNVANSLLVGCAKIGVDVAIVAPKALWTSESLWKRCDEYAKESGATIEITDDLDGVKGADVIYTDVWISMGEEKKEQERERLGKPYQVNAALMERTGKDTTIFSHCLPAIKEKEVTEEVFEGPQSRVFDEAENRLHTIKAVMVATLGENE